MLSSLDAAYAFTRDTPRNRSAQEAHWKLNRAYFDLIFAWGYSQSGNVVRARELLEEARAALPRFDAVHQTALRAFEFRISERSASPWTRLQVDAAALESLDRYRVMRLFETLAILSRVESQDAIQHFWRQQATGDEAIPLHEDLVTEVLVADGEGRTDDVRAGLDKVFASDWVIGAVLIGPCRRAGRETELRAMLTRRPASEVAVALEALGAENVEIQFEQLGTHAVQCVANARKHIGALALCGRVAEAQTLAARAWTDASDSFNTNEAFSIVALGACETIVLSALRHELAPGNRSLLEPIAPDKRVPSVPSRDEEQGDSELSAMFAALASALRDVAVMAGTFQERFSLQYHRVRSLLSQHSAPSNELPLLDVLTLKERVRSVTSLIDTLEAALGLPEQARQAEWEREGKPILDEIAALVAAFENRNPAAKLAQQQVAGALNAIQGGLRSIVVERPAMTRARFEQLRAAREPLDRFFNGFWEPLPDVNQRRWIELPFDELVALIASSVELAKREVSSIPNDWDPGMVASAQKCITLVSSLLRDGF